MLEIKTENPRLALYLFTRKHSKELHQLVQDNYDHLLEWRRWADSLSSLNNVDYFISANQRDFKLYRSDPKGKYNVQNSGFQLGMFHEGELAGVVGFQGLHLINRVCAVGYWVAEPWQGKGLVTQGTKALVKHAFEQMEMNRIEIECTTVNKRSQGIPKRVGFTAEATLAEVERRDGKYLDHILFRLLKKDWKTK